METQDALIALEMLHEEMLALAGALDLAEREVPCSASWSPREVPAHMSAWNDLNAERLRALAEGREPFGWVDDAKEDAFNAAAITSYGLVVQRGPLGRPPTRPRGPRRAKPPLL